MASGHRKRKAAALRIEVLNPAGLTNVSEADRGVTTNQNNLINIATYSRDGVTPTFTAASTTLLSDAVSNADGAWTKAGLTGETTNAGVFVATSMSGAVGILSSGTKHYYFPAVGGVGTSLSVAGPAIVYSGEGPQASYVPYYLGGTTATGSIFFDSKITGSGTHTHVLVYVGGELASGDQIRLVTPLGAILNAKVATGSNTSFSTVVTNGATASASELSSALYRKAFAFQTSSVSSGFIVEFSSSAKTSTTPVAGVFVAISSGSY
jgi:hypothetical protein